LNERWRNTTKREKPPLTPPQEGNCSSLKGRLGGAYGISNELQVDIRKFNAQYEPIDVKVFAKSHDRFLIIDEATVYHIGASLKDLAKKWFAFSRIELDANEMINKLEI